jgi:hypothetical protein
MPYAFIGCHNGEIIICYSQAKDEQRASHVRIQEGRENKTIKLKYYEKSCAQLWKLELDD